MDPQSNANLTVLLNAAGEGDSRAASELLPVVYDELRRLASQRMAHEPAGLTLQATALVHEAYLRLIKDTDVRWNGRNHFFAAAAIAMRRILVERARAVAGPKRGGGRKRVDLDAVDAGGGGDRASMGGGGSGGPDSPEAVVDWLALDEALAALEKEDPRLAEVVMLRFFAGLSVEKAAEVLGISDRQVKREWAVARAWLYEKMTGEAPTG